MAYSISIYNKMFLENIEHREEYGDITESYNFIMENHILKNSKILEIGCNIGSLLNLLSKSGFTQITGIDIATDAIKYGKNKYPKLKNNLLISKGDMIPFKDNEFDVVLSFDLLEHMPNVNNYLNEVHRVLKPNGIYLFQTPNKIINIPWTVLVTKSLTEWKIYHCSLQTYWGLQKCLLDNSFRDISIQKRVTTTKYNRNKVKKIKYFGNILVNSLYIIQKMPVFLSSNFWVKAIKL